MPQSKNETQFCRTQMLLGEQSLKTLQNSRVCVFGLGGVGSFVVESLVRAGIGSIDIVDKDTVSISNINRQLYALHSTVGKPKVDIAEQRILDINPNCKVVKHNLFFLPETASCFDFSNYDYIVDCIDTVTAKILIIEMAKKVNRPVISSMGTGNKLNPSLFQISDISKTEVCPLARVMRKELKKRNISDVKVLFSTEQPKNQISPILEDGKAIPGSISFVPSVAGLLIASEVINDLCRISSTQ